MFPQCSVEQRCAELQSLLETERNRVYELGACQEQLERRARELDTEVTTVRAEAERERDRLTSQAEVRWGHCVCIIGHFGEFVFVDDGFCVHKTSVVLPLAVLILAVYGLGQLEPTRVPGC